MEVKIGISNRHVHLTKEHVEFLFGEGYQLTMVRSLSQPGQYVCEEKVTIKTPKREISGVRVLGPERPYTQVEISKTDAYTLGINPPVRDSGKIAGSAPITIVGPKGEFSLEEGCIIANRHIHLSPAKVRELGIDPSKEARIQVMTEKGGILEHVVYKVDDSYEYELHLDTDDGNAFLLNQGDIGILLERED